MDYMRTEIPLRDRTEAQNATNDEVRGTLVRYLKLGLIPFLNETRVVNQLDVRYTAPAMGETAATTAASDPWNNWVFRTNVNGFGSSESSSKRVSLNGSFTADRTTEEWHARLFARSHYTERRYNFSDGTKLSSYTNGYDGSALVVKSRGPHWSIFNNIVNPRLGTG